MASMPKAGTPKPFQLVVEGGPKGTLKAAPVSKLGLTSRFVGGTGTPQLMAGAVVSFTVTVKEQVSVLPEASYATKVFVVVPTGNAVPLARPAIWAILGVEDQEITTWPFPVRVPEVFVWLVPALKLPPPPPTAPSHPP